MFAHPQPTTTGNDRRHGLSVVARESSGLPRTYRLAPSCAQRSAYRRLAVAILGLDVARLGDELRAARTSALARLASAS
jgi:hypothetical protein